MALSPVDQAIVGLSEIEDDARSARAAAGAPPPEPSSLHAARTALTDATRTLETRQSDLDGAKIAVRLLQQRRPWWHVAIGLLTGGNHRRAHELRSATAQQSSAQAALAEAKRIRSDADNQLAREVSAHRQAVNQHVEHWTQAAKAAEEKAAASPQAYELLRHLPGAVRLGAAGLCDIASKLVPQQEEQSFEVYDYTATPLATQP